MDGLAVAALKTVVAALHFLVPRAEPSRPPAVPLRTGKSEEHRVPIRDARPLIGRLSLEKEGFVLLHHQTVIMNFSATGRASPSKIWSPETSNTRTARARPIRSPT